MLFKFENPAFLNALWIIPVLALLLLNFWYWRKRQLQLLGEPSQAGTWVSGFSAPRFWVKNGILLLVITCFLLALANPQRGARMQKVSQNSADVFIALDISQSMRAEDVAPSRLEIAKVFVQKLIRALDGERIGLIFFAGNAFLQLPLSTDYDFMLESVQNADPELISSQGTAIGAAIDLAEKSFDSEPSGRAVIVVSDGENHGDEVEKRAEAAFDDGMVIYPVGVGSVDGGTIPIIENGIPGFKRDENGAIVRTRLDEAGMIKMAAAGGGRYFSASLGDASVQAIKREIDALPKRALEVRSQSSYETYFQWFLLPGLLLLLIDAFISWRSSNYK